MNMKGHILAALKEEFNIWEELLTKLNDEQISIPLLPSYWTIKDVVNHVWAWQQRSISRVEAALNDREPDYPNWLPGVDPNDYSGTDRVNAWIYQAYHDLPWPQVKQNWENGFQRFLELSDKVSEKDLLDGDRYPWLDGFSLAAILVASYDHHQEHLEKFQAWLAEHAN